LHEYEPHLPVRFDGFAFVALLEQWRQHPTVQTHFLRLPPEGFRLHYPIAGVFALDSRQPCNLRYSQ
jgi:hypothetical protein